MFLSSILLLENDMSAIRAEHDDQTRLIHSQKSALMSIIGDLGSLRLMGKETETPREVSPAMEPSQSSPDAAAPSSPTPGATTPAVIDPDLEKEEGEEREEKEEGEEDDHQSSDDVPLAFDNRLNPKARPFVPSRNSTPALPTLRKAQERAGPSVSASAPASGAKGRTVTEAVDDDIEMGELAEEPVKSKQKKVREEELEEGEASDQSSVLSDVPDDI